MNLSEKTLLISGISGFIGLRATAIALTKGMKVRGLQHSQLQAQKAQQLGAEVIVGSVTDPAAVRKACQDVDIVLHTAAIVKEHGSLKEFRDVNVGGTINMAKAAKNAGVKTFVHLSSVIVYGYNYPNYVTESGPIFAENHPYCQTKIESEKELLRLNSPPDFNIIILRPGDVYGPGSYPWVVRPLAMMRQKIFLLANNGQGVMNHLYVDNLIDAIFLAMEKEAYGEVLNITDGEETSWQEYFTRLADIAGLSAPSSLPKNELKLLIQLRYQGQKLLGQKVDIVPETLDFITRPYAYSVVKAEKLLNYKPKIDLEEGMRRTQEWLQTVDLNVLDK
ncbi:NAD-dependent epimerase/dehydratase family protein [Anabaena cylindrica FACHB-243]|uniref:NAD-dependent epimerase/dehydratase n=1 Tax=Anabaena cylindrica (strain ATCC 27899 / PCC 7122) TaxID=272123 RepID=K9ZGW9_ANACC|nr:MULTISPECIES: NAD-dependent epimerase/dehydratase family protein [Anabaena]AFZ58483.1 NAD-dependent epimerase/dehydratase [Anabaena cylindrica PCC 7122]MBD2417296.1 NAD-dependent epimerase/dehydratase family protein [Anabaena cylindrica FACHB-243]MBY5281417.1 NAD-dependent epimerase/dehydratase family protein [Anabaena sp. CCAP 1446/1C]MBY5310192.1 NAD-dependent epimerase/dehydratase family protein [Anabaena sp. CCAP 1446/1C]MCM2410013.1 NAD-dependent epimerase/dehydratase family protein [A